MKKRRKVSAPLREFLQEVERLLRYDQANQRAAQPGAGSSISQHQLEMLSEWIFFSAFRAYENFVRDVFLLYCQEKQPVSGGAVKSFLKPKSFAHAEELVQSGMKYVDWAAPDPSIKRAETYLENGYPVKFAFTTHRQALQEMKAIRNHIAHRSQSSLQPYLAVVRAHYSIVPLAVPEPGRLLLQPDRQDPTKHKLVVYLEDLKKTAHAMT